MIPQQEKKTYLPILSVISDYGPGKSYKDITLFFIQIGA